jgi:hypothetical protein
MGGITWLSAPYVVEIGVVSRKSRDASIYRVTLLGQHAKRDILIHHDLTK